MGSSSRMACPWVAMLAMRRVDDSSSLSLLLEDPSPTSLDLSLVWLSILKDWCEVFLMVWSWSLIQNHLSVWASSWIHASIYSYWLPTSFFQLLISQQTLSFSVNSKQEMSSLNESYSSTFRRIPPFLNLSSWSSDKCLIKFNCKFFSNTNWILLSMGF